MYSISVISSIVESEDTVSAAAKQCVLDRLRVFKGFNAAMLRSVQMLTKEQVQKALSTWLVQLFDPTKRLVNLGLFCL